MGIPISYLQDVLDQRKSSMQGETSHHNAQGEGQDQPDSQTMHPNHTTKPKAARPSTSSTSDTKEVTADLPSLISQQEHESTKQMV
jgi:hypothetical protein